MKHVSGPVAAAAVAAVLFSFTAPADARAIQHGAFHHGGFSIPDIGSFRHLGSIPNLSSLRHGSIPNLGVLRHGSIAGLGSLRRFGSIHDLGALRGSIGSLGSISSFGGLGGLGGFGHWFGGGGRDVGAAYD